MSNVKRIPDSPQGQAANISGRSMDRIVAKKTPWSTKVGYGAVAVLGLVFAWWLVTALLGGTSLNVDSQRIIVSKVTVGTFEDFIPLRGRLVPSSTVYLDAIAGGRVEEVLVEDGALVQPGQPIARLSNTNLQLEVLGREAAVTEQLNDMRTLELQLEQNRLSHKRDLVEINYQVKRLTRAVARQKELVAKKLVPQSTIDDLQDELDYNVNKREVTLESQATDARLQETQLTQLKASNEQLEKSLTFARKNLDDLNIRAPIAGKLSGFAIEVGQSIEPGGRLGQIDDPDGYKLSANIDEYYLGRVDLKQVAIVEQNGRDLKLRVAKIYPQIENGQFRVDMTFDEQPSGLRRGQTMQLKLTLGDNSDAVLIPNGSFYQETGGNWVFVVSPDGTEAVRRSVKLGRRNTDYIEVLDGLEPGERVVTSPYTNYVDMDRLKID